jgi:hypothetical protein
VTPGARNSARRVRPHDAAARAPVSQWEGEPAPIGTPQVALKCAEYTVVSG